MGLSTILHARRNLLDLVSTPVPDFDFETGLVANFKLNELLTETEIAFDSFGNHDAINNGTTPGETGKFGKCHSFSGAATSHLEIPNHADFQFGAQPFTIRFFFNMAQVKNTIFVDKTLSTNNREWYVYFTAANLKFRIFKFSNTSDYLNIDFPINPIVNTWYEFVGTWDGTENASGIKSYVNAVSGNAGSKNGAFVSPTPGSANVLIGRHSGLSFELNGKMDEIYFWKNRYFTQEEVETMHNNGNPLIWIP